MVKVKVVGSRKKLPASTPTIRFQAYTVIEEAIAGGLRGFLWNDFPMKAPATEGEVAYAVERALARVMIELEQVIDFNE